MYILKHEDIPLLEFMYLTFTRVPGESYRRRLRSLVLYLCDVFRALINSLLYWCAGAWAVCFLVLLLMYFLVFICFCLLVCFECSMSASDQCVYMDDNDKSYNKDAEQYSFVCFRQFLISHLRFNENVTSESVCSLLTTYYVRLSLQ